VRPNPPAGAKFVPRDTSLAEGEYVPCPAGPPLLLVPMPVDYPAGLYVAGVWDGEARRIGRTAEPRSIEDAMAEGRELAGRLAAKRAEEA
jgi:hypothetical protein